LPPSPLPFTITIAIKIPHHNCHQNSLSQLPSQSTVIVTIVIIINYDCCHHNQSLMWLPSQLAVPVLVLIDIIISHCHYLLLLGHISGTSLPFTTWEWYFIVCYASLAKPSFIIIQQYCLYSHGVIFFPSSSWIISLAATHMRLKYETLNTQTIEMFSDKLKKNRN
jgi:hypothetical protein